MILEHLENVLQVSTVYQEQVQVLQQMGQQEIDVQRVLRVH